MSKQEQKKRRRKKIVDAAEKVIFANGIEQATMDEIAQEAELSKGTLYLYFKNKNELYLAIAERGSNLLNEKITRVFAGDHTGIELIRLMGETYLDFVQQNPGYYNAFTFYEALKDAEELEESEMAQTCEENTQQALNLMVRALQIGMQDGTIQSSYEPKELAIIIWGSTRGITMVNHLKETGHYFKMLEEMEINKESLFRNFINLIGNGMATEKGKNIND